MKTFFASLIFLLPFALLTGQAEAQQTASIVLPAANTAASVSGVCPNPKKLRGLCMFVDSKEKDPNPQGRFVWKYQRKLLEAACADPAKDSEEEIGRKIAKLWKDNEATLICNNTKFDVPNGSVLKFAVNLKFDEFLIDATHWKVNLNKVDEMDGRTLLDYIRAQIERNKGLPAEPTLKQYYTMLKKAGAKHKSEL